MTEPVLGVTPPWMNDPIQVPLSTETGTWWISTGLSTNANPPAGEHTYDHRWGFANSPATRVAHPSVAAAWDAVAAWFGEQTRPVRIRRRFTKVDLTNAPVVDVTDPVTQDRLGITLDLLTARDPSACQYLGQAFWEAGARALKVPTPTDDRFAILFTVDAAGVTVDDHHVEEYSPAGWPVVVDGHGPDTPGSSYLEVVTTTYGTT